MSYRVIVIIRGNVYKVANIVSGTFMCSENGGCCYHHHHHLHLHRLHLLNIFIMLITTIFIHHHHHHLFIVFIIFIFYKVNFCPYWEYQFLKTKNAIVCVCVCTCTRTRVCLLKTFYLEIIAFPDRTLYSAVGRVIATATATLKGFQGRVN